MITILAVSDGYKHFKEGIKTYETRIERYATIKLIKPISHTNTEYIRVKETLLIQDALKKLSGIVYLCDERGKGMTTPLFTEMIENARNTSENIIFIIGGSYGVDLELMGKIPHKLIRVSDFVMPHSLALLVLIEQIYRAHEILRWSGYHHA